MYKTTLILAALLAAPLSHSFAQPSKGLLAPLRGVHRVVFFGDSITYSGGYIEILDAYIRLQAPQSRIELINMGLPSETVSGLTEPNHAGGAFPRPDLHERLARALEQLKPDMVIACYGMNDGIYHPLSEERFQKYQEGMRRLQAAVKRSKAKFWVLTPPPFDPLPIQRDTLPSGRAEYPSGRPFEGYDTVLGRYSEWLLSQRRAGWKVIDIHTPLNYYVAVKRQTEPRFALSDDGVHLHELGQQLIAGEILRVWGAAKQPPSNPDLFHQILALVQERQRLLKDAWLNAVGHKRPGMSAGVPLPQAEQQAKELDERLRRLIPTLPPETDQDPTNAFTKD